MTKGYARAALLGALLISYANQPADAIGKKAFLRQLDEALKSIVTFQADVVQESIYPDGIVQRYSGKLAVSEEGRIAYDYNLEGEFEDPSLVRKDTAESFPVEGIPRPQHRTQQEGTYLAKGERVVHRVKGQSFYVESSAEENLLIQLFRVLVGAGDFDLEAFLDNHKIQGIQETKLEGVPVYVMIAQPKKSSELYRRWSQTTANEMVEWRQELWVQQTDMEPLKAVLTMSNESTSILLSNVRINHPVDPSVFLGPDLPRVVREGLLPPIQNEVESTVPVEKPLQEIQIEQ